jgi:hypothetical protein
MPLECLKGFWPDFWFIIFLVNITMKPKLTPIFIMRNLYLIALIFLVTFSLDKPVFAQQKKETKPKTQAQKQTVKTETAKTTQEPIKKAEEPVKPAAVSDEPGILQKHSKSVQKIFKTEKGVFRGYDYGTSIDKVKQTEDAQYVADGKDFAIYKLTVNENEVVEILYYLDEKKNIRGFGIEFPVHISKKAEADLIEDLQNYFNERFGKYTVNAKNDEYWISKDGSYTIEMGDSSEAADMLEIEIDIFQKSK